MGAFLVNALMTLAIVFGAISAIGISWLGVDVAAERLPALAAASLLGCVTIAPLGTALDLVPPNTDSAVPIVNGLFFPPTFLTGAFFAVPLPEPVQVVIDVLPGKPLMGLFAGATAAIRPVCDTRATAILLTQVLIGAVATTKWFKWASERGPWGFSQRRTARDEHGD